MPPIFIPLRYIRQHLSLIFIPLRYIRQHLSPLLFQNGTNCTRNVTGFPSFVSAFGSFAPKIGVSVHKNPNAVHKNSLCSVTFLYQNWGLHFPCIPCFFHPFSLHNITLVQMVQKNIQGVGAWAHIHSHTYIYRFTIKLKGVA